RAVGLEAAHEVGYPLETREALEARSAVLLGDAGLEVGGYDRFHGGGSRGHEAQLLARQEDVVEVQGTELVPRDQDEAAPRIRNGDAEPVGVGVVRHHDVGLNPGAQL